MFVKRLTFSVYMPGQIVAKKGQQCYNLYMFIEGKVEAMETLPEKVRRKGVDQYFTSEDSGDDN